MLLFVLGVLIAGFCHDVQAAIGKLYVPINRSELVASPVTMGEVIVANPDVADIYVHGQDKVSVIGRAIGQTTLRLFDEENQLIREMDVMVTYDLPSIRKALKEYLPYERIGVEMLNTRVALVGEVTSAEAANTAIEIASQFLNVSLEAEETEEAIDPDQLIGSIVNLMKVVAGQQVMLRVRVGEIQRSALKNLGVNLQAIKSSGSVPFNLATGALVGFPFDATPGDGGFANSAGVAASPGDLFGLGGISFTNSSGDNGVTALVDALERDGIFKVLAEPNLVALSGEEAEFLAGGEVPIPVAQGDNGITVDYRPFGVSVRFRPYVLSENRIRVQVQPEVSEISNETTVEVAAGISVPTFNIRRANTTVELAPGESFMIAGLIQDTMTSTISQLPGVSEIPILSALFRSTAYQRNETELVLAVTPYIVDPMKTTDVRLPTDNFRPASFMENVFYGALGSLSGGTEKFSQTPTLEGPIGFMVD